MSGRGRGRGRGFGRGAGAPEIKDDDGQYVAHGVAGPPPLYPENPELADRADPTEEEEELKVWWRALTSSWQNSPYFLQVTEAKKPGRKRSLEDFTDTRAQVRGIDTSRLAKALTLHPKYFPEELYSAKERRVSVRATDAATQQSFWASNSARDAAGRFDRLAHLEAQAGLGDEVGSPKGNAEPKFKTEGDNEDEAEPVEVDEPDEEDFEDDDYLQGAEYDDDEGYEDDALEDEEGGAYY